MTHTQEIEAAGWRRALVREAFLAGTPLHEHEVRLACPSLDDHDVHITLEVLVGRGELYRTVTPDTRSWVYTPTGRRENSR